ncbi:MAG: MarR family winged helix-turn-helix transcriptional regulator [Puniceicoccaceae bacterium]
MNGFFLRNLPDRECLDEMAQRYPEMDADASEVYLHFMRLGSEVGSRVADYLAQYDLSTGRMSILMMLNSCPDEQRNPGELAERCGVTPATVTRLIDNLIKDGHIERVVNPDNRRVSPVRLTTSGKAFLEKLLPGYFSEIVNDFGPLSATERKTFLTLLLKLQNHLNDKNASQ